MPADIRPFRRRDRQAVRDICAATCWMGEHRADAIPDDWVWAEYWTRYFTDIEPQHTWVAVMDERVVGYLTGTVEAARFDAYVPRLLPGIVWHVIRRRLVRNPASRAALAALGRSLLRDDHALPPALLRRFPATLHVDLLSPARRGGLGSRLMDAFLDRLRQLGVRGVHAQHLSLNLAAARSLRKAGFQPLRSCPTTAFGHIHPGPISVQTWGMELPGRR